MADWATDGARMVLIRKYNYTLLSNGVRLAIPRFSLACLVRKTKFRGF